MSIAEAPHKILMNPVLKEELSFTCRSKREVLPKMRATLGFDTK